MMQHEFGHVLQYRKVGSNFYYKIIAKESMLNCKGIWPYNGIPHDEYWTETWANYLSKQKFGEAWLGMEKKLAKHLDFYYPSKNISSSFLLQKNILFFNISYEEISDCENNNINVYIHIILFLCCGL